MLALLLMPGSARAQVVVPVAADYCFTLTSLPPNTPPDATLYLVGSFNNWQPADSSHRFRRQADGSYLATVRSARPALEYKISRGSWAAVEGDAHGHVRANRRVRRAEARADCIEVRVRSWEDLTGTFQFYSLYDLLLLFSSFQGLLLLVALPSVQEANRRANRWLLWLLGLGAAATLLRVVSSYREVANALPTLQLLPDFVGLLYGPLFYGYLRRLLLADRPPLRRWAWHFIPAGLQLLGYLPYFLLDGYEFQLRLVSQDGLLRGLLLAIGAAGLLSGAGYWLASRRLLRAYVPAYQARVATEQPLGYLRVVLGLQAVCLGLWAFLFGLVLASRLLPFDVYYLADRNADLIWLAFSTIPYFLGFVAIQQPEIFKLGARRAAPAPPAAAAAVAAPPALASAPETSAPPPAPAAAETPTLPPAPLSPELAAQAEGLRQYMARHRPYVNANLTLHELAAGLALPPHALSRLLNEGFGQSFFDFVNSYRVEAFKQRLAAPDAGRFTLLGLALEVGFNSKTAFNRAFKKHTGQTPSEWNLTP